MIRMYRNYTLLVNELRKLPKENTWVEFKHNKWTPEMIGEDISALANGATISDKDTAYLIWGIDNDTQEIVGTNFDFSKEKKGNQELEHWVRNMLSPNAEFEYVFTDVEGFNVGIMSIRKAIKTPVTFQKRPYIRVGSNVKPLAEYPALQEKLWSKLNLSRFEELAAVGDQTLDKALSLINYTKYFDALKIVQPSGYENIAHYLLEDKLLVKQDNGLYSITNLGLLLFAKKLSDYPVLYRKVIRVVAYEGNNRMNILKETTFDEGYALCLDNVVNYIDALLPGKEVIDSMARHTDSVYPLSAVREILANACIHQDLTISGTSILVEIFEGRIEVTNPGIPLINIERILDNPPRSRNESLSSLMRRMKMCEELGSGWDRMVISCELKQLPAPRISIYQDNTRITLFGRTLYANMSESDRLWSCYMHACIKYIQDEQITNASLRERFGVAESSSGSMSRLIKLAIEKKLIKPLFESTAPRYMRYVPIWA